MIKDCACDASCKLCGYGIKGRNNSDTYNTSGRTRSSTKAKWPTGANQCLSCASDTQVLEKSDGNDFGSCVDPPPPPPAKDDAKATTAAPKAAASGDGDEEVNYVRRKPGEVCDHETGLSGCEEGYQCGRLEIIPIDPEDL